MNEAPLDLALCHREPIHIPGSTQPHGVLLVVDPATMRISHAAGPADALLGTGWHGMTLADALGARHAAMLKEKVEAAEAGILRRVEVGLARAPHDAGYHLSGDHLIVEIELASEAGTSAALLPRLESAAAAFERAPTIQALCNLAAAEFRRLTGYDRIMIYQFVEDDAGTVVAEDRAPGQRSFLHHHFPATDIPSQARALYVRNLVRVIPDVSYKPAPLVPTWDKSEPLDMSDSVLRSVSPVHVQYLKNMGVGASASVSIVKDGRLWGLIACHNEVPKTIASDVRVACRALAGGLARQIKAREETDAYRERVRLRSFEDYIVALLSLEGSLDEAISNHLNEIMNMLDGDGVAVLRGKDIIAGGVCPAEPVIAGLARWVADQPVQPVFATNQLSGQFDLPQEDRSRAAGLLATVLSASEPWVVLWFRSEQVEVVNWAGNPHKDLSAGPGGVLNPRSSFEAWTETVRGRSRRWTIPEVEAAARLSIAVSNVWQTRRIRELNRELMNTLAEKDTLIRQKEFLIGEVNHRVQNSLQLVSSFLSLQAQTSDDPSLQAAIAEARRRISAVTLVHRRLYRSNQIEAIDAARYVADLMSDLLASIGPEWNEHLDLDLEPVMLPNDRAIGMGLVLTELVINLIKYAYAGAPGPLLVRLSEERNQFHLVVADQGVGRVSKRKGFGSRMIDALVAQLGGTLAYEGNAPGTRAVLAAPVVVDEKGAQGGPRRGSAP